jgi:hypothetical protein
LWSFGNFMRASFFAAFLIVCSADVFAAMAPPSSLAGTISESTIVATVRINAVRKAGDFEFATATVIQPLKGTKEGETLTIETRATLAETAHYRTGEQCLVFLGRRGSRYDTPRGMFGRYSIRDQKVLRWIVGRRQPVDLPLVSVVSEIRRATKP